MTEVCPIRIPVEAFSFSVVGKPWVQKNNLMIMYKNPRAKVGAFVGHSTEMSRARDAMSASLFSQFRAQGGHKPIDYPVEVSFVFYVLRAHEPDVDNLPAIVCDAMQGIRVKGTRARVASILEDDKLICRLTARKITKGDINYDGEPRTELTLCRYPGSRS